MFFYRKNMKISGLFDFCWIMIDVKTMNFMKHVSYRSVKWSKNELFLFFFHFFSLIFLLFLCSTDVKKASKSRKFCFLVHLELMCWTKKFKNCQKANKNKKSAQSNLQQRGFFFSHFVVFFGVTCKKRVLFFTKRSFFCKD